MSSFGWEHVIFFAGFPFFYMGGKYFRLVVGQGFLGFYLVWGFDIALLVDTRPFSSFIFCCKLVAYISHIHSPCETLLLWIFFSFISLFFSGEFFFFGSFTCTTSSSM